MMQTIKDLADAFVPSGKLVEMVDKALVSTIFLHLNIEISYYYCIYKTLFHTRHIFYCCSTICPALSSGHPAISLRR